MLVLGVDPGTALTGYALVAEREKGPYLVQAGVLRTEVGATAGERLMVIHRGVLELARAHAPEAAAVEEVFFSRNVRTALAVGQARGVVLLALAQAGVPIYEYKPNEVKETVTGYGAADKRQVQEMVRLLLDLAEPLRPDDVADAAAIALCHMQCSRLARALHDAGLSGAQ